jgi:isochorismate hydrolase
MRLIQHQMSQILIIDIQDKVLELIGNQGDIHTKAGLLIQSAKLLRIPVLATEQQPKEQGHTASGIRTLLGLDVVIFEKLHFSALRHDGLRDLLETHRDHGRGQIIIAGIEAHIGVMQTALDLINEGFEVFVVSDAIGSRAPASREIAMRRLERSGAFLVDAEMVIFEWLEKAGTPEYKSVSALLN